MAENMMNSDHKATNEKYRDGYERTFGKKCCGKCHGEERTLIRHGAWVPCEQCKKEKSEE